MSGLTTAGRVMRRPFLMATEWNFEVDGDFCALLRCVAVTWWGRSNCVILEASQERTFEVAVMVVVL